MHHVQLLYKNKINFILKSLKIAYFITKMHKLKFTQFLC